ncbi:efflux RND transporter periplasmic adaptor subunit, partial [Bacteroidota bacterium]
QMLANYKIVAPVSGVVNKIFAEEGSFASPGAPIIQLVDITKLLLDISIDQEMIPTFLKMGQKVKVTTDVYPEVVFDGLIETVNVNADASQKIDIGIAVNNTETHPLLGGMFGRAEFIFDKKYTDISVLAIPRDAIIGSIQDAQVYVLKADSTVALRDIIVGRTLENNVEVVSGLTEGEEVVTAGQINLEEGAKVIVKN